MQQGEVSDRRAVWFRASHWLTSFKVCCYFLSTMERSQLLRHCQLSIWLPITTRHQNMMSWAVSWRRPAGPRHDQDMNWSIMDTESGMSMPGEDSHSILQHVLLALTYRWCNPLASSGKGSQVDGDVRDCSLGAWSRPYRPRGSDDWTLI